MSDDLTFDGTEEGDASNGVTLEHSEIEYEAQQKVIIEKCIKSRIFFCEVVLGVTLEAWQRKVLRKLDRGERRISISSGNGVGKTFIVAVIAVHYLLFRNDVKIPVTAPASSTLNDGLRPECIKWINVLPDFLRSTLHITSTRIVRRDAPENNFISFRTARKETPEALSGIHARFVMCLVDEASAVPDVVYEMAQGTMSTPGSIFIMISNPTRLNGYFYQTHHNPRLKRRWFRMTLSSFDTSRVDQDFVDTICDTYGEGSNQYLVKVLGKFPRSEDETLIGRDIAESALWRDIKATTETPVWGVDCGRGGDPSAIVARFGNVVDMAELFNSNDTMKVVGWIKDKYDKANLKPEAIYVDSIGIGAGVADRLRELNLPAIDVNVSESASMKSMYPRLRDELWHILKAWFESKSVSIQIGDEDIANQLIDEVSAPLQIFTSTGKNGVESKQQLKARYIPSPNLADALCHTFAFQGSVAAGAWSSSKSSAWNTEQEYDGAPSVW